MEKEINRLFALFYFHFYSFCPRRYCSVSPQTANQSEHAPTDKISRSKRYIACSDVVEVGRVELPSESTLTGSSPGAGGYSQSLALCVPLPDGKPARHRGR